MLRRQRIRAGGLILLLGDSIHGLSQRFWAFSYKQEGDESCDHHGGYNHFPSGSPIAARGSQHFVEKRRDAKTCKPRSGKSDTHSASAIAPKPPGHSGSRGDQRRKADAGSVGHAERNDIMPGL